MKKIKYQLIVLTKHSARGKVVRSGGTSLVSAFRTAFKNGAVKVVVVRADAAELNKELIKDIFDSLDIHDAALGLLGRGGFYLVALRRPLPKFLAEISMDGKNATRKMIKAAGKMGVSIRLFPPVTPSP